MKHNKGNLQAETTRRQVQTGYFFRMLDLTFSSQFHVTQRDKIGHSMFPSTACSHREVNIAVNFRRACLSGTTAKGKTWAVGPGSKGENQAATQGLGPRKEPICRNGRCTDGEPAEELCSLR